MIAVAILVAFLLVLAAEFVMWLWWWGFRGPHGRRARQEEGTGEVMICDKKNCTRVAARRFTWPGNDEMYMCVGCSTDAQRIANAIGLHLQMIDLGPNFVRPNKEADSDVRCRRDA